MEEDATRADAGAESQSIPVLDGDANLAAKDVRVDLHIPMATFGATAAAILLSMAMFKLWPLLLLLALSTLLAVTLHSMVSWLVDRRFSRRLALWIVLGSLFVLLAFGAVIILPELVEQLGGLGDRIPALQSELLAKMSSDSHLRHSMESLLGSWQSMDMGAILGNFLTVGGMAFNGISQVVLLLVIAVYFVVDGGKTYRWLLAFFPPRIRRRIYHTSTETSQVIFAYVVGQAITSGLVFGYTFCVLSLLQVPAVLMLAIVAGILDVVPMVGFLMYTTPAVLLALTVSPRTALLVAVLYLLYAAAESFLIEPRVYGRRLRLSPLSVLLGLLFGTLLAGIPGAVAALPLVASYAVIERIWLKRFLGEGVSEKHELQKNTEFGEKS